MFVFRSIIAATHVFFYIYDKLKLLLSWAFMVKCAFSIFLSKTDQLPWRVCLRACFPESSARLAGSVQTGDPLTSHHLLYVRHFVCVVADGDYWGRLVVVEEGFAGRRRRMGGGVKGLLESLGFACLRRWRLTIHKIGRGARRLHNTATTHRLSRLYALLMATRWGVGGGVGPGGRDGRAKWCEQRNLVGVVGGRGARSVLFIFTRFSGKTTWGATARRMWWCAHFESCVKVACSWLNQQPLSYITSAGDSSIKQHGLNFIFFPPSFSGEWRLLCLYFAFL